MRRLICTFVVRIWQKHVFSWRGSILIIIPSSARFQILSNLLDLVKDRAEAAEAELERVITEFNEAQESSSESSTEEKTSVGALSGVSVGSDDVFDGSVFEKAQVVIVCDWEVTPLAWHVCSIL